MDGFSLRARAIELIGGSLDNWTGSYWDKLTPEERKRREKEAESLFNQAAIIELETHGKIIGGRP